MEKAVFVRESIDFLQQYLMKSLQKYSEEHGVTIPQARVIAEVFANKSVSIKQLSTKLKMTQSTVSDIVERLTSKGLLVKTPNPKDKRSVEISLSSELSEGITANISEISNQALSEVLSLLKPEEQETVTKGMELLVSAVKEKMVADGMEHYDFFDVVFFPEKTTKKSEDVR
ncbi:MarR family transcriptional regulator [Robertmurraya yapensis]|uniref:MarR family transcriptional regulator n=2 Tax=Bacillaceae TaxID=186817 RepID=A0A431W194_9BACI|nr:MarR family transcriptional regulator [Bacillus yapensis]RTR29103.1 MarR family transcriptional regulator [Bacillus yapensis]TKS94708.1 MarR family transcriptional regulator [Bacillus yapensis]